MHFCKECQNMYYIRMDSENSNKLVYYCRHCGHEDTNFNVTNISISKRQFKTNENNFSTIINQYTKLDPTLPRVTNIKCPTVECSTHNKEQHDNEIIYIRYDDINMKYIYLCPICNVVWKSGEKY